MYQFSDLFGIMVPFPLKSHTSAMVSSAEGKGNTSRTYQASSSRVTGRKIEPKNALVRLSASIFRWFLHKMHCKHTQSSLAVAFDVSLVVICRVIATHAKHVHDMEDGSGSVSDARTHLMTWKSWQDSCAAESRGTKFSSALAVVTFVRPHLQP